MDPQVRYALANREETMADPSPSPSEILDRMKRLKAEHRPIVEQIAADPGMQPETRLEILRHVLDEEDELLGITPVAPQNPTPPQGPRQGLTVGSLRAPEPAPTGRGTVGTFRTP